MTVSSIRGTPTHPGSIPGEPDAKTTGKVMSVAALIEALDKKADEGSGLEAASTRCVYSRPSSRGVKVPGAVDYLEMARKICAWVESQKPRTASEDSDSELETASEDSDSELETASEGSFKKVPGDDDGMSVGSAGSTGSTKAVTGEDGVPRRRNAFACMVLLALQGFLDENRRSSTVPRR